MAAKRQNTHRRTEYSTYVEGNTVRKAAPERHYEGAVPKKRRRRSAQL